MLPRIIFAILVAGLSTFAIKAQKLESICKSTFQYENRNQVDPKPSSVSSIAGRVITEVGNPAKEGGPWPACLRLFTENDHRLVASAVADKEGHFKFSSVPAGSYRLVVRDPQNAFCVANMPLSVVRSLRGKAKPLLIHMRPSGVDGCSYGDFK